MISVRYLYRVTDSIVAVSRRYVYSVSPPQITVGGCEAGPDPADMPGGMTINVVDGVLPVQVIAQGRRSISGYVIMIHCGVGNDGLNNSAGIYRYRHGLQCRIPARDYGVGVPAQPPEEGGYQQQDQQKSFSSGRSA